MLVALSIRDIVLIDHLDLSLARGLTIFTGETGAGKSIVLDSLSLALGARGDGRLVRKGAQSASVTASFELHPLTSCQRSPSRAESSMARICSSFGVSNTRTGAQRPS